MASADADVSTKIWNGKIPLQVTLDSTEAHLLAKDKAIDPIFIEVPRCSYFPLITEQLFPLFTGLGVELDTDDVQVWYEYQGQPLKWHYPIGLLYDMQGRSELPWRITIRFSNFPADKLLRNPSVESAQDMFMAMVKQADFLRHGTTKRVMNLSKSDQTQLWRSLWSDKYEDYWNVNQNLVSDSELRSVPLRIYLPDDCPVIQELVSYTDQGNPRTLGNVLGDILPDLFTPSDEECDLVPIIHGIVLPLETPIQWASQNLSFADNFLHLVVCKKNATL